MKKAYVAPWAKAQELSERDIITTSIFLSTNQNANDDGGDFGSFFVANRGRSSQFGICLRLPFDKFYGEYLRGDVFNVFIRSNNTECLDTIVAKRYLFRSFLY